LLSGIENGIGISKNIYQFPSLEQETRSKEKEKHLHTLMLQKQKKQLDTIHFTFIVFQPLFMVHH